ncbi:MULTISPECIES: lipopolysaccharide biosynthesis protein [Acidobacteriaceae]|uniref:lipopolysaccharide biosynthesis protein n=1 Tax=Acidobacteriaceae TaxID=204434 RepID=UPI00131C0FC9|nr:MULTISPECIES: oligosaccharide flippase family protein [Acidobacteriaceae]MDW5267880.1 oligosaccharide flippase family protein [Edaphobacter sp.]
MYSSMQRIRRRISEDPRLGRILHGGASALVSRGVALLVSAITLPLTIRYLGPLQYGIWITISTTVVMLAVMDLGIANTLTNMISQAYAHDDRGAAQRYYATAFWSSVSISTVLGLIALMLWPHMNWGDLFHLQNPALIHEVSLCVAIALGFFLLSLPLNLVHRILSGYQQTQITNYFTLMSNILSLIVIVTVIKLRGSLVTLMLMYSCALLFGNVLLNIWVNLWDRPWLMPSPRFIRRAVVSDLMSTGMGFFVLQLAGIVVFNSDNLIITHYLGAADVTPYSVTWRLAGYAAVLQTAVLPSLWPAYAEAYARGEYGWVRRMFWNTVKVAMGAVAIAVLILSFFGQWLIRWYAGPAAVPTALLLFAICAWTLLCAGMELQACLLAAINRIKVQGILSVFAAALNIVLSIYLVKRLGSLGVILGTILSYLLILVVPQTVIVWRALYRPPQKAAILDIRDKQHA